MIAIKQLQDIEGSWPSMSNCHIPQPPRPPCSADLRVRCFFCRSLLLVLPYRSRRGQSFPPLPLIWSLHGFLHGRFVTFSDTCQAQVNKYPYVLRKLHLSLNCPLENSGWIPALLVCSTTSDGHREWSCVLQANGPPWHALVAMHTRILLPTCVLNLDKKNTLSSIIQPLL